MSKTIWLKRSPEWIKDNPGKGTMYKVDENNIEIPSTQKRLPTKTSIARQIKDSGVYIILCEKNKRVYVGQSDNMGSRMRNHKMVICGTHQNLNSSAYIDMRRDWKMFGEKHFEFIRYKTMPTSPKRDLLAAECEVMFEFIRKGYNLYNRSVSYNANAVHTPSHLIELIQNIITKCENEDFIKKLKEFLS